MAGRLGHPPARHAPFSYRRGPPPSWLARLPSGEARTRNTPARASGERRVGLGTGTTPPLGLGHLRDDLERSKGTAKGPAETHARAPGDARRGRREGPSPPRGRPDARHGASASKGMAARVRQPHRRRPEAGAGGRDRAGVRTPASPHASRRRGENTKGPRAEREERPRSSRTPVPHIWRSLDPARENTTTPHRSGRYGDELKGARREPGEDRRLPHRPRPDHGRAASRDPLWRTRTPDTRSDKGHGTPNGQDRGMLSYGARPPSVPVAGERVR